MFRSKKHIENNLPLLSKKGLITTTINRSRDEYGNFISKRTIRINWEKLQEIKTEMDEYINQELVDDNSKDLTQENTQQEEPIDGITYLEKNGEQYLVKNHQDIHLRYIGVGSQISLYFLDSNNRKENFTRTTKRKLNDYLDSSKKQFEDLTNSDLINLN